MSIKSELKIVGRAREQAELDRVIEAARNGQSDVLVLRGDAGMGKTALLRHAACRADGMTVLRATGVQAEYDLAFSGLHALLWPIADRLAQVPEPQRGALAAALGLAPSRDAPAESRDRFLVSAGALSLLAAAAEAGPLLCVIDDAQWLDVPSAAALVFTARRVVAEGIAILIGAREGDVMRFAQSGLRELALDPLDHRCSETLVARAAPHAVPSVRGRLLSEAGGNPLALLELSAALSDAQLAGRAPLPEVLPLTARLRAAFTQQIRGLPASAQTALLIASADNEGEPRVLRLALSRLELPQDALEPAQAAGLVSSGGGALAFRHPLVRSAVYESASLDRRRQVHHALAEAFGKEQRADRALWHRAIAVDAPDERIAAALEDSARRCQQRGGHASAASAFERAAALSEDPAASAGRLAMAAEAAWGAGQTGRARALIDRCMSTAGDGLRVRLMYLSGVIEGRHGWLGQGAALLRNAASLSTDSSLGLQMLREACSMAVYAGDYEEVIAIGTDAEALAPDGDVDHYISAAIRAYAADLAGDHASGSVLAAEALDIAKRLDDPMCLISAAATAARQRVAADSLPFANRAVEIARERGLVSTLPFALQAQARALIGSSQFDLAYAAAEEGRRLAHDVQQPWAASLNLAYLARIDALRGAEQLVQERVAELQALVAASGANALTCSVAMTLGLLELGLGRPAQALDRLLVVASTVRPESNPLFALGVPDAVEAAARADRLGELSEHFRRFEAWAQAYPNPARLSMLGRCRGLMDEDADQSFAQASELADALSPFDRARGELLYGEWLRRHRQRVDARAHLRAALDVFGQLGASPWEERARAELRASGETARRRDAASRDLLTPQELQIARLVAGGMSNPDIAAQLFLSPRTIDYHLRKVFAKLDIASRSDLAGLELGDALAS